MALTPKEIREAQFTAVRRAGYDVAEVDAFQQLVADALQAALDGAAVMEARARAAVARLKKWSEQQAEAGRAGAPAPVAAESPRSSGDDVTEAAKTLVLAQRTADAAVAEARAEAERTVHDARANADAAVAAAQSEAARLVDEARAAATREGQVLKDAADAEVQQLVARRMFLESDVELLDRHIRAQRERITEVVAELEALTNRTVNGLATLRGPQLSAAHLSDDPTPPSFGATVGEPVPAVTEAAVDDDAAAERPADEPVDEPVEVTAEPPFPDQFSDDPLADEPLGHEPLTDDAWAAPPDELPGERIAIATEAVEFDLAADDEAVTGEQLVTEYDPAAGVEQPDDLQGDDEPGEGQQADDEPGDDDPGDDERRDGDPGLPPLDMSKPLFG